MGAAQLWDRRRTATLIAVVGLHAVLLGALWLYAPRWQPEAPPPRALELLFLPPSPPSKIRPDNFRPHRIGTDTTISMAPPVPGSLAMAPSTSGADGTGAGVDWSAEARRALQAYEIRSAKRSSSPAPSDATAESGWWPRAQHHAGEQYKTDSGDWIVWINSSCYQVAKAAASYVPGAVLPRTICPGKDGRAPDAAHPDG